MSTRVEAALTRRNAEQRIGGAGKSGGQLIVLQKLAGGAVKDIANRRKLGEMKVTGAGLDPVIGQPRHAEQARHRLLRQAKGAAAAAQPGANTRLRIIIQKHWHSFALWAE